MNRQGQQQRAGWLAVLGVMVSGWACATEPSPYLPEAGTAILYHFSEGTGTTVADASGNARTGTFASATVTWQDGQTGFGKAILPNQANDNWGRVAYTATGAGTNSFLYSKAAADFTVEAWIRMLTPLRFQNAHILTVQPVSSADTDWQFFIFGTNNEWNPGALSFGDNSGNKAFAGGGLSWDTNVWYHVAAVVHQDFATPANSYCRIYRTPAGTSPAIKVGEMSVGYATRNIAPVTWNNNDRVLNIGNFYGDSGVRWFNGRVDEVRYSTTARAPSEFTTLLPRKQGSTVVVVH